MGDAWYWTLAAPLWLVVLIYGLRTAKDWPGIMARWNERRRDASAERAGDWSRLRAEIRRLDDRCDHLQREVDECREREGVWMQRAIAAESALMGKGEVKQEAQRIVSAEREIDAGKRRAKDV
jgi:hypothetical protein